MTAAAYLSHIIAHRHDNNSMSTGAKVCSGAQKSDSAADIFTRIYRSNGWKSSESRSGPGSCVHRTLNIRTEIPQIVEELNIRSFIDAPCGDFNWIKLIVDQIPNYRGMDIVHDVVKRNKALYPEVSFQVGNVVTDLLECDLLLCRDCLFHFTQTDVMKTINNIKRGKVRYLLTTDFENPTYVNKKLSTGQFAPIRLQSKPYNFPAPLRKIKEDSPHKYLSLWRVEDLPQYKV